MSTVNSVRGDSFNNETSAQLEIHPEIYHPILSSRSVTTERSVRGTNQKPHKLLTFIRAERLLLCDKVIER